MLQTNLEHVTTNEQYKKLLGENDNVMICCGRMGPMCIPVYQDMQVLRSEYPHVKMVDMDFDEPVAANIRALPEVRLSKTALTSSGLPAAAVPAGSCIVAVPRTACNLVPGSPSREYMCRWVVLSASRVGVS